MLIKKSYYILVATVNTFPNDMCMFNLCYSDISLNSIQLVSIFYKKNKLKENK